MTSDPIIMQAIGIAAGAVYLTALALLLLYAVHGLWLLWRFRRAVGPAQATESSENDAPLPADDDLPVVLVQLPVFNERDVVERVLEAAVALDWPKDRLEIQLLDDSTDDSVAIAARIVERLQQAGHPVSHLHRTDRTGFKAGALEAGMAASKAEYVAIFDADFVPRPDFLKRAMSPLLADDGLALVQGRWEHHNREQNLLTRVQAIGIDGHFAVEQSARAWTGLAMNFNGTCGVWRRSAIDDGGGWQHDTLTEDLDLSYRVQLKGWRCTYRIGLDVPGELPADIRAWRSQQFRWAKGSQQTARKLAGPILRSNWTWTHKVAALLHMTHYAVHPLMLASLLSAPLALWLAPMPPVWVLALGAAAFLIGVFAPIATYIVSQFTLHGHGAWKYLRHLPVLASLGTGIAISNGKAVWEAWSGKVTPFVRTPKTGDGPGSYRARSSTGIPELLCMLWAGSGIAAGWTTGHVWAMPLMAIYASGFGWVGLLLLQSWLQQRRGERSTSGPSWSTGLAVGILGLIGVTCYAMLGLHDSSWQYAPGWFAGWGLGAGAVYLLASWLVVRRPGRRTTLIAILGFAVLFRIAAFGITASDDLNRYIVEGQQLAHGQNPYAVAPLDDRAVNLVGDEVAPEIFAQVNHPRWTAIYPPAALSMHMVVSHVGANVTTMNVAAAILELTAMLVVVAVLVQQGLSHNLVLLAAWNPVGPLWFAGEGHNDSLMVLLVALFLLLALQRRPALSAITLSLAALAKPFAAWLFLEHARRFGWRWLWIPTLVGLLAYLPFIGAGWGIFGSLGRFGGELHYHGALEPFYRLMLIGVLPADVLRPVVVTLLVATLAIGSWLILRRATADETPMLRSGRLLALLLLCLPTCYPWYMLVLVICLPFIARSAGLLVWTAMAPVFYLHGFAILEARAAGGDWGEWPLITAIAHTPAILLLGWEAIGRPGLPMRNSTSADSALPSSA